MDAASQGLAIVREILDGVLIESCHPSSFKEMGEVSEEEWKEFVKVESFNEDDTVSIFGRVDGKDVEIERQMAH